MLLLQCSGTHVHSNSPRVSSDSAEILAGNSQHYKVLTWLRMQLLLYGFSVTPKSSCIQQIPMISSTRFCTPKGCIGYTALLVSFRAVTLCPCSYKLGHSEVQSTGEPQGALLTPAPSAAQQTDGQTSNMIQGGPEMQQPYADSSLLDRIQQLETDMTKVSIPAPAQYHVMHTLHDWLVVLQVQNMLLLHSERIDSISSNTG